MTNIHYLLKDHGYINQLKTVLDYMDFLEGIEEVKILDLGSGIGKK